VNGIPFQRHGGIQPSDLIGLDRDTSWVLDFSASLNPLGPPPAVYAALTSFDPSRYPDPECKALREALAARDGVQPEQILIGNGSTELIHLAVRLFVHKGQRPIVFSPTFSEFERAVEIVGGRAYPWTATAQRGFRWALRNKPAVLDRVRPPLVWLCNPNNPTGVYLAREIVESLASSLSEGPLLLDEAYRGFVDAPWTSVDLVDTGRVICLRSLTKEFAIPALRLGYMIAHRDIVTAAGNLQPEWSVNGVALAAGVAALGCPNWIEQGRAASNEAKGVLGQAFGSMGFDIVEGAANFLLVNVGDAALCRSRLLQHGIAVRNCASFGLPGYVRIGMRPMADCERLIDEMAHLREDGTLHSSAEPARQ
jgi:histidinol-phosphate aminotransferase